MVVCTLDKLSITVRVCYPNISCLIPPHVHQHTHWAGFDAVLSSSCILLMLLVAFTMVRLMRARPCKLADRPPGTACKDLTWNSWSPGLTSTALLASRHRHCRKALEQDDESKETEQLRAA